MRQVKIILGFWKSQQQTNQKAEDVFSGVVQTDMIFNFAYKYNVFKCIIKTPQYGSVPDTEIIMP